MPLPISDASFGDMKSIISVLTEEERAGFRPLPGNLRRGEASFHHPLTVHGSFANKSVAIASLSLLLWYECSNSF